MKTLLWREYRFNGLVLVAGACLLCLPYLFMGIYLLWPKEIATFRSDIAEGFTAAAGMSYALSQLTVALLAGNSIAGERADRSAEFMAYLPVSKSRRLVSKLSLAIIVIAVIWGVNLLVLWGLETFLSGRIDTKRPAFQPDYTFITGLCMFGISWLISSLQSSPALAVCGGILMPILILFGMQFGAWALELSNHDEYEHFFATTYIVSSISLGILGLIAGSWYFLKRVEP